jgi:hypothetical protein
MESELGTDNHKHKSLPLNIKLLRISLWHPSPRVSSKEDVFGRSDSVLRQTKSNPKRSHRTEENKKALELNSLKNKNVMIKHRLTIRYPKSKI